MQLQNLKDSIVVEAYKILDGKKQRVKTLVALESPINIYLNKELIASLFASPSLLKELALGYLFGEGIIKGLEDIESISVRGNNVYVSSKEDLSLRVKAAKTIKIIDSSCGSTDDFYKLLDRIDKPFVKSDFKITVSQIRDMWKKINEASEIFKMGGAVHSSAIFQNNKMVAFAEDVGRHNATDKVIGIGLLNKIDFSRSVLIGTGRQPASMVLKIARSGIPISISIRGPIHSGIHVAEKTGLTLIAFSRKTGLTIYTHPERIIEI
ncbi:Sulfurtransferase FdhD [archaeon HR06]|nr:Sulfurtransferase FdhD [archaeon HR06]